MKKTLFTVLFLTLNTFGVGCSIGQKPHAHHVYHNVAGDAEIYVRTVDSDTLEPISGVIINVNAVVPDWPGAKNNFDISKMIVQKIPTGPDGVAKIIQIKTLDLTISAKKTNYTWVRPQNDSGIGRYPVWRFHKNARGPGHVSGGPTATRQEPYILYLRRDSVRQDSKKIRLGDP